MIKNASQWQLKSLILGILVVLVFVGTIVLNKDSSIANAALQGTSVNLIPPNEAFVGELIRVKLVVNNAQNLAGYQSTVRYDVNNLRITGVIEANDLSFSGRDIMLLESVWHEDTVSMGAATCPVSNCSDSQYASASHYTQGVNGYVELATLELVAQTPGRYDLILENVQLVDPQGNQMGTTIVNATLEISSK